MKDLTGHTPIVPPEGEIVPSRPAPELGTTPDGLTFTDSKLFGPSPELLHHQQTEADAARRTADEVARPTQDFVDRPVNVHNDVPQNPERPRDPMDVAATESIAQSLQALVHGARATALIDQTPQPAEAPYLQSQGFNSDDF